MSYHISEFPHLQIYQSKYPTARCNPLMFLLHSNNTDHHHLDHCDNHLISLPLDQHYYCNQYYFALRSYRDHQLNYSQMYYYYRQKNYMVALLGLIVDKLYCYYKQLDTDMNWFDRRLDRNWFDRRLDMNWFDRTLDKNWFDRTLDRNWFDRRLEIFPPKSYCRSVIPQCNFLHQ
jgi:hypothetical protein